MQGEDIPVMGPHQPAPDAPVVGSGGARPNARYLLHLGLFLATYATTTYAGLFFVAPSTAQNFDDLLAHWPGALTYSTLLMCFLAAHEFGHYVAARLHGMNATLPYFIPLPELNPFGTMGAVIRLRSPFTSRKVLFDVGVAGPLAGFVVAFACLVIGIVTMPGIESLYAIHPEYVSRAIPADGLTFSDIPILAGLRALLVSPGRFFPPMNEIYHYPFLTVGWFGMFVTALNMMPFGQLDGGHVTYAMFGGRQRGIARWFFRFLLFVVLGRVAGLLYDATRSYHPEGWYQFLQGIFGPPLEWVARYAPWWYSGWPGWIVFALLVRFFFKLDHPPVSDAEPIGPLRTAIGWLALLIFVLTFPYTGIS